MQDLEVPGGIGKSGWWNNNKKPPNLKKYTDVQTQEAYKNPNIF